MTTIEELFGHQAWADAEPLARDASARDGAGRQADLRAPSPHPRRAARVPVDPRGERVAIPTPADFATPADLKRYAVEYHARPQPTSPR